MLESINLSQGVTNPIRTKLMENVAKYEDSYHVANVLVLGQYWINAVKNEIVPDFDNLTFSLWGIRLVIDRRNDYTCSVGYVASKEDING